MPLRKPKGWQVRTIAVVSEQEEFHVVRQALCQGVFAVHEPPPAFVQNKRWYVTHIPSGRVATMVGTCKDAQRCAEELLGRWNHLFQEEDGKKIKKIAPKSVVEWLKKCREMNRYTPYPKVGTDVETAN